MTSDIVSSGRRRGAGAATDDAIEKIRRARRVGAWGPGMRLPREVDLAKQLGLSRNSLREAVRALSQARILEVRQGDGTYVSSLDAGELLEPTLSATHLLRGRTVLELFEVRRMLEPEAAALAAQRADEEVSTALRAELDRMIAAGDRADDLVEADAAFHDVIAGAPGGCSGRCCAASRRAPSVRASGTASRIAAPSTWPARSTPASTRRSRRGRPTSRASALLHIATNENWLRQHLDPAEDVPLDRGG